LNTKEETTGEARSRQPRGGEQQLEARRVGQLQWTGFEKGGAGSRGQEPQGRGETRRAGRAAPLDAISERLPSSFSVNEKHVKNRIRAFLLILPINDAKSLSNFESISQI
jgi:hypothetical protein